MSDILGNALTWLAGKRDELMTVTVVYRRGTLQVQIQASRGRTPVDSDEAGGFEVRTYATDYIVKASDLFLDEEATTPQRGDQIIDEIAGESKVFEVMPLNGEVYRWCDPAGNDLRIHCKLVKRAEASQA